MPKTLVLADRGKHFTVCCKIIINAQYVRYEKLAHKYINDHRKIYRFIWHCSLIQCVVIGKGKLEPIVVRRLPEIRRILQLKVYDKQCIYNQQTGIVSFLSLFTAILLY